MKPTSGKPLAVCALALLVALAPAPGWSQAASPPAPQEEEKFESKIVWGILIQFAFPFEDANLSGSNVHDVNLSGLKITKANLQ